MKVYEILSLHKEFLKQLHNFGIKVKDYKFVMLYDEYLRMKYGGDKVTYIIAFLSKKHKVCERKIYKVIKMMESECRVCAVE